MKKMNICSRRISGGKKAALGLVVFLLVFALFDNAGGAEAKGSQAIKDAKNDYILVKYKDQEDVVSVKIKNNEKLEDVLGQYNNYGNVEYAEPNFIYRASILPSDSHFDKQWYLKKIKAVEAWDAVRDSPEIKIAIIDSGVQISHPDLRDNIWRNEKEIAGNGIDDDKNGYADDVNGWDFIEENGDPNPKFGSGYTIDGIMHGTIVAGVAAASGNNAAGISGVTWKAKIMPLRVLNEKGEGDTRRVIKAIDYAINNGADIINLSFVGFGYSQSMEAVIRRAYNAGIVVVAAAGNEGQHDSGADLDSTPMYPVCHDGGYGENMVLGVSATDALDQKAVFSAYGFKCIDISAPGISIFSTSVYRPDKKYADKPFDEYYGGYWSGTSMAVPMVSGAAALLKAANPRVSRMEIINILRDTADNINQLNPYHLGQLGRGRLNIFAAIQKAKKDIEAYQVKLLFAPLSGAPGKIDITDRKSEKINGFLAYGENFHGGVNIATGDVDGDGIEEIIVGAGSGGGPHIRIFDQEGNLKSQFFAYNENFRGGVKVAVGDVDGDGTGEVVAGAGFGGGPHVRIFDSAGNLKGQFFAYNENFRGGVNVASGDVDGDGLDEIITGAGAGGGPQIRIFSKYGELDGQFFAYDPGFRGGVNVHSADVDSGSVLKKAEIITSPGKGGGPQIRIFNNHAGIISQFFAYRANMRGGVSIAGGDIDNDGLEEIITGAGSGGAPHARIFEKDGTLLGSFYALEPEFEGGLSVEAIISKL